MVHFHYIHTYRYEMRDTSADIKIKFLNDVVEEEVYAKKPLGVETHDRKKSLYKLKRHPWDNTYMRILKIT